MEASNEKLAKHAKRSDKIKHKENHAWNYKSKNIMQNPAFIQQVKSVCFFKFSRLIKYHNVTNIPK